MGSIENQRAVRMTLVSQVAQSYFELVALDNELSIVRKTVEARREGLHLARIRYEGGLTSETAFRQAQVELARTATLVPDLERKISLKENELAFLTGDIENRLALADTAAKLQQQRGFADAGRTADQHQRPTHGAAAEHAVKFADACGKSQFLLGIQLRDQLGLRDALCACAERRLGLFRCFHKGVPRAARRALPHPFCRLIAAFRAIKDGFCT